MGAVLQGSREHHLGGGLSRQVQAVSECVQACTYGSITHVQLYTHIHSLHTSLSGGPSRMHAPPPTHTHTHTHTHYAVCTHTLEYHLGCGLGRRVQAASGPPHTHTQHVHTHACTRMTCTHTTPTHNAHTHMHIHTYAHSVVAKDELDNMLRHPNMKKVRQWIVMCGAMC